MKMHGHKAWLRGSLLTLAVLLCLGPAVACAPRAAAETAMVDVGNAYINFMLNTAIASEGKTAEDFGFTPQWSGYFIRAVAEAGGMSDIFPPAAECANGERLLAAFPKYGGQTTVFYADMTDVIGKSGVTQTTADKYEPRPGDIVVLRTSYDAAGSSCISRYAHVGLVMSVSADAITVISGNWNGQVTVGTAFARTGTTEYDSFYYSVAGYARPDYPYTVAELGIRYNANGGVIEGQDHVISYYRIIAASGINMRKGPNTGYGVVGTIPKGTEFAVEETAQSASYVWGHTVCNGNMEGWLVISNPAWTVRYDLDATDFYLDADGLVYDRLPETPKSDKMLCGTDYPDGVPAAGELGITRTGYTFAGWSLTPTGSVTVSPHTALRPEALYPNLINGSHELTLYAVWTKSGRQSAAAARPAGTSDEAELPGAEAAVPAALTAPGPQSDRPGAVAGTAAAAMLSLFAVRALCAEKLIRKKEDLNEK